MTNFYVHDSMEDLWCCPAYLH